MTKEHRQKLAELIRDNPELDIRGKVAQECVSECDWMMCNASFPRLDEYVEYREEIYLMSDINGLYEQIADEIDECIDSSVVMERIAALPKTRCIIIGVSP